MALQLGVDDELGQRRQPRGALSTERDRVGLPIGDPVDERLGHGVCVGAGGGGAVLVDGHRCAPQ